MNVLSLFDGMSCGQIALNRAGIEYNNYYASEIDKYAVKVSSDNFPNTIHLGDVTQVKAENLPKIDLLIGGSPCQGFSIAGKQLNFDDPRSALFFEYVRLLKELKPKYFLLENVVMKREFQDIITEHLGVRPIKINSSVVSAQSRNRLYWTNIPIEPIERKDIYLKDILEKNVPSKYYLSEKLVQGFLDKKSSWKNSFKPLTEEDKASCLTARYYKTAASDPYILEKPLRVGNLNSGGQGDRIYSVEAKSVCLSALGGGRGAKTGLYLVQDDSKEVCFNYSSSGRGNGVVESRVNEADKSNTLTASGFSNRSFTGVYYTNQGIRKLTPLECKRLQTVPDDYKMEVSDTQAYKMLGNGWTVDIIAHIFKGMKNND
jgi:DNA-cytosine methyltransferase